MRAIDCPCGHRLEGADDAKLFRLAREHIDRDHPSAGVAAPGVGRAWVGPGGV
jgi:hypothetical protein